MFGWFKRKDRQLSPELMALADKLIGAQALAVAIAESVRDYAIAIENRQIEFPAYRRKNSNVQTIWEDTRVEAMRAMFGFGLSDLSLLADLRRQAELFRVFVDGRPH